jgi:hypothetical protein
LPLALIRNLVPHRHFASSEGLIKADEETSDEEVARADLVRGLLRMNLLSRLRYLLEVWRLPSHVAEWFGDGELRLIVRC